MQHLLCVAEKCYGIHLFNSQIKHLRISHYCLVSATSWAWDVNPAVFILVHALLPINWFGKWNLAAYPGYLQMESNFHNSTDSSELLQYVVKILFCCLFPLENFGRTPGLTASNQYFQNHKQQLCTHIKPHNFNKRQILWNKNADFIKMIHLIKLRDGFIKKLYQ